MSHMITISEIITKMIGGKRRTGTLACPQRALLALRMTPTRTLQQRVLLEAAPWKTCNRFLLRIK